MTAQEEFLAAQNAYARNQREIEELRRTPPAPGKSLDDAVRSHYEDAAREQA